MTALPDRVDTLLGGSDLPWSVRWDGLAAVVADLSDLVRGGSGAREVAERVAERLVLAVEQDREHRVALSELADRVVDLHAVACAEDPPDPVALADWLLRVQTGFREPPEVRLAPYAAALGEAGLRRYRERAVARFAALPVIGFGETGRYDRLRWALLRVMEELAEHTGEVDLQVLVLARDLSSGWHYLQVATVLRDAGRSDEAVGWVRRGLAATGGRGAAARLVDLAVDECLRLGRVGEAVGLRLEAFRARPSLETYTRLRGTAAPFGRWPELREEALAHLGSTSVEVLREVVEAELRSASGAGVARWLQRLRSALERAGRPELFGGHLEAARSRHAGDPGVLEELARRGL